jgi:hypothetical protein
MEAQTELETNQMKTYIDITDKIGPLWQPPQPREWPMYSYDRPSYMLWNSIANTLHERGWTETEIKQWLQSKSTRWALDGSLGDAIEKLGRDYGKLAEQLDES